MMKNPTPMEFQDEITRLTAMEGSIFLLSGTMGTQIVVRSCRLLGRPNGDWVHMEAHAKRTSMVSKLTGKKRRLTRTSHAMLQE